MWFRAKNFILPLESLGETSRLFVIVARNKKTAWRLIQLYLNQHGRGRTAPPRVHPSPCPRQHVSIFVYPTAHRMQGKGPAGHWLVGILFNVPDRSNLLSGGAPLY